MVARSRVMCRAHLRQLPSWLISAMREAQLRTVGARRGSSPWIELAHLKSRARVVIATRGRIGAHR
jgi:hypothetical protein